MKYKLGSLFDGSGGFPLAGSMCGIEPMWAAEIEPYPIAVTRSRFPNMKHLGDIRKVNGADIEPVDIITFGSPCQDLSVAGKRAGLKHEVSGHDETTRSGLFMEAVRIIKEMRGATNGKYPRFALWENVPGAFSSNNGEDFRTVCQELIKIVEPTAIMPAVPKKGWSYADSYIGDGWSLAYRVFDAQYWGVPQRRRRIHLVVDFRGERAREVLFEREGVRGYFETGRTPWQGLAGTAQDCTGTDDREGEGIDGGDRGRELDAVSFEPGIASRVGDHIYEGVGGTLRANAGDNQLTVAYTLKIRSGCEGGGKGALVQEDLSATLATNNDQYLFQPVSIENHPADSRVDIDESGKVQTLTSRMGTGGGNVPMVMEPQPVYCLQGNGIDRADTAGCDGKGVTEDVSYTLNTIDRHAVAFQTYQKVTGPLMANSHPGSYTGQDAFSDMLVAGEKPVCYRQGGFAEYIEGEVGTLRATGGDFGGGSENLIRIRYIVRRLTPTECARLQGFADRWGDIEEKDCFTDEEFQFWHDVRNTHAIINGRKVQEYTEKQMLTWYNKLHTDSAEYKMWGNGIALPPALYCMQGMVDVLDGKNEICRSVRDEDGRQMTIWNFPEALP